MTDTEVADDAILPNGVDYDTGDYLAPKQPLADLADALRRDSSPPAEARALRRRRQDDEDHFGVVYGRNPHDLGSVGWGVVIPHGFDPASLEALAPLMKLREEQAGNLFQRLEIAPGEDKDDFLARHGMGPSVVDPRKVPYYLLLLGSPQQVPFEVQYQLGVSYAVGRLDLEGADAYAAYAATVLASERGLSTPTPQASPTAALRLHFFATRHPGDAPTALSSSRLVDPLMAEIQETAASWELTSDVGPGASRTRLEHLLTEPVAPDILFTATHGVGGRSAPRDLAGALLCQDWPGPFGPRGPLDDTQFLAAHHIPTGAAVGPKVVFSFACFGAGTPQVSDYPGGPDGQAVLAEMAFTSRLPQKFLGAPAGGALAFIGHVDRAWSCSFLWKGLGAQVTPFSSTLLALMDGARLGWAMESLTSRYAEIATELTLRMDGFRRYGKRIDDADLVGLWTATHDARAQVIIGDPAIRVAVSGSAGLRAG